MHKNLSARTGVSLSIVLAASFASALAADGPKEPHADIWIRIVDGAIVTGSITEGTPGDPIAENERVFAADLGEDPKLPFAAAEPGFQSLPSDETAGAVFSFSVTGPLLAWTGSNVETSDLTMTIEFGPSSVTTDDGAVLGFNFAAQPSGLMHDHFFYYLNGSDGGEPAPGVYLLPMSFSGSNPLYAPSETFWVVFNNGLAEEDHDAAIAYAEKYLACGIDLTGDGSVDGADVGAVLGAWGTTEGAADLNRDGLVDAADLGELLGAWGFACP